jgi:uncharacterized membrane protein YfcA
MTSIEFYAVAIPSVVILGLSKGGFAGAGLLSLPLMALVVPPLQAASILLPILLVQDVVSVWAYRRTWDAWNLSVLLPAAAVGVFAGYLLAARVSTAGVEFTLGLFSILFGVHQLLKSLGASVAPAAKPGIAIGWACGAASGFTSMIAHAGSPPFQFYVMPQRLARDVFVGTSVLFFAAVNLIKVPPFMALGQFTQGNMIAAATLMPVAVASTWAGVLLVRRASGPLFFAIISALLVLVGVKLTWDGFFGL